MSLYRDAAASPADVAVAMGRLRAAFPKMGNEFFNLLAERVTATGFTSERLRDAVNHVLDTFRYKELNISDIISFDRRARLYGYNEVCTMVSKGEAAFADFVTREVGGRVWRVRKSELAR